MVALGKRTVKALWIISIVIQTLFWLNLINFNCIIVWGSIAMTEKTLNFLIPNSVSEVIERVWDSAEEKILAVLKKLIKKIRKKPEDPILPMYIISNHM